jgi:hypothetical protein
MKRSLSKIEGLSAEIENLKTLGPEELDQTWRDLFESSFSVRGGHSVLRLKWRSSRVRRNLADWPSHHRFDPSQ